MTAKGGWVKLHYGPCTVGFMYTRVYVHKGPCTLGSRRFAQLKYQFSRTEPNTDTTAVLAAVGAVPNRPSVAPKVKCQASEHEGCCQAVLQLRMVRWRETECGDMACINVQHADTGGDGDVRGVGYVVRILGVMVTSEVYGML